MQYRRISADCHLDMIWLPPDLFTSEAPRALKEKMPYVADQPDGTKRWVDNEGADFGMAGGGRGGGSAVVSGKELAVPTTVGGRRFGDLSKKGGCRPRHRP